MRTVALSIPLVIAARFVCAQQSDFAGLLRTEIGVIDTTVTLAAWRAGHTTDRIAKRDPTLDIAFGAAICSTAERRWKLDARRTVVRTAVFFPPPMQSADSFPADTGALARGACRLGAIWLEQFEAAPDTVKPPQRLGAVVTALRDRFGEPRLNSRATVQFGDDVRGRHWRTPNATISLVADYSPGPDSRRPTDDFRSSLIHLGVVAYANGSPYDPDHSSPVELRPNPARLDSAITLSGIGETAAAPMRLLLFAKPVSPDDSTQARVLRQLLRAVRPWMGAAKALGPARRAAALLVADEVVHHMAPGIAPTTGGNAARFDSLRALGASYDEDVGFVYTRRWLWDAYKLDPSGLAGELAFLTLLQHGWSTAPQCDATKPDVFQRVIDRGEAYLRRPDAPHAAEVHLVVAHAYADIVALAAGVSPATMGDFARLRPRVTAARRAALTHYRAAFAALRDAAAREEAWDGAWYLQAGLAPEAVYFVCVTQ